MRSFDLMGITFSGAGGSRARLCRFQSEAEKEPLGESPINKERESPKDSLFVIRLGFETFFFSLTLSLCLPKTSIFV